MEEHIYTRLKVSKTHGVKLCLFCKKGVELYDRYKWYVNKYRNTFYLARNVRIGGDDRTIILFHRELLELDTREIFGDHWNGNGLDNQLSNIRPATPQENVCNMRISPNNTSGIKGVSWCKHINKWMARITHEGQIYTLGYFEDIKEATDIVRKRREKLHKDFTNHG